LSYFLVETCNIYLVITILFIIAIFQYALYDNNKLIIKDNSILKFTKKIFLLKKLIFITFLVMLTAVSAFGQRRIVNLPNIPGYVTLKCDFHLRTVFSDGNVGRQ